MVNQSKSPTIVLQSIVPVTKQASTLFISSILADLTPSPHEYRYLHYEMRDKVPLLPIGYLHYLVKQYDRQAQTHTNFDEPIPPEGVVLRAPTDLLDLHIIQEGDMNLVWGNVQLAIKEMRKYYEGKATEVEGYWSEVAIQFNYFLEGWARMVERVPTPQECPIKSTAATLDSAS